ncbi:MAG: hypothetical protein E7039_01945 [Lentisphaerae bacterium]|nr:hypothetical protein [Lentisphaerota bacterium]
MTVNKKDRVIFENIGGSFQFQSCCANDLSKILTLDPTAWAALSVPVASLNGDPAFFKALDEDGNGMVRVDEVKIAIKWLIGLLKNIKVLNKACDTLPLDELNCETPEGMILVEFANKYASELLSEDKTLNLAGIRKKLSAVTAGPLAGDGVLRSKAVADPAALALYNDITKLLNTPDSLTAPALEKFALDAASFVEWSHTAEKPLFRGNDPVEYYAPFKALVSKIDEYFRFCELIKIDPAHAARFSLNPAALPELDLQDSAKIDTVLSTAPLAMPSAEAVLNLAGATNPFYQDKIKEFIGTFNISSITADEWKTLKADFAPYIDYLAKAQGDLAGQLGKEKLEQYLAGNEIDSLRKLFEEDKALGGVVDTLKKLERLLLYCRYMLEFINNFVSFKNFFDCDQKSMLQAGRLIMDGKSYNLAVWIDDIASHKKIAVRSNMCLLYLDVVSSGKVPIKRKVAVAVTGGSLARIYVGKPAFFIDNDNITYNGKVIDLVDGPISFGQTLFAPFRRLSDALNDKIQKLTDFSSTEKQLAKAIDQGKMPPATPVPPTVPMTQKFMNNGSVMLLAGGLSLAALGAGLSFILKSITNAITSISALPFYVILIWIAVLIAIFMVPTAIFAFLKLRKRNLTLFLEAGGWAVNLHMRLNMYVSGIFTRGTEYPENTQFKVCKVPKKRRSLLFILLIIAVLLTAGATLWYLNRAVPGAVAK